MLMEHSHRSVYDFDTHVCSSFTTLALSLSLSIKIHQPCIEVVLCRSGIGISNDNDKFCWGVVPNMNIFCIPGWLSPILSTFKIPFAVLNVFYLPGWLSQILLTFNIPYTVLLARLQEGPFLFFIQFSPQSPPSCTALLPPYHLPELRYCCMLHACISLSTLGHLSFFFKTYPCLMDSSSFKQKFSSISIFLSNLNLKAIGIWARIIVEITLELVWNTSTLNTT